MRGRRRQPDEIKALRGNPHGHRLSLERVMGTSPPLPRVKIEVPDFLTHARERKLFMCVVKEHTESRIARPTDLFAYGRWASYVHLWITMKEKLVSPTYTSKSKHGTLRRKRPEFSAMVDLERLVKNLEDRLGLNPMARQTIINGLMTLPHPPQALFEDAPDVSSDADSPLGWLARTRSGKYP
jgi:phage terminase small subunit